MTFKHLLSLIDGNKKAKLSVLDERRKLRFGKIEIHLLAILTAFRSHELAPRLRKMDARMASILDVLQRSGRSYFIQLRQVARARNTTKAIQKYPGLT